MRERIIGDERGDEGERLKELVLNDRNRVMAREAARSVPGALPPPPMTRSGRRGRHARAIDR